MTITRRLEPDDAEQLTALYGDYAWWADRSVDDVRSAIEQTDVGIGIERDDRLVAAARILTDFQYYAMVFDVIVAADRRGEGLGSSLMESVVDVPELREIDELTLQCRTGLVSFYRDVGFELYDTEAPLPDGGEEPFVLMTYAPES